MVRPVGRWRWIARASIAALLALIGCVLLAAVVLVRSPACEALPREDLSLREMAELRSRMDHYKVEGTRLDLTARQASFLMREELDVPAWLHIDGPVLRVEARLGEGTARCTSVSYQGAFEVDAGRIYVVPQAFRVGPLDLGWWVHDRRLALPEVVMAVGGPKLVDLFDHVQTLRVADGGMSLQLDDPLWIR